MTNITDLGWGDFGNSRYLKAGDVPERGMNVTISKIEKENVAPEGELRKNKPVIRFKELDKGLVCNATNSQLLKSLTGSADPSDLVGKRACIYTDPTVAFAGRITGGIRFREAFNDEFDDAIPF